MSGTQTNEVGKLKATIRTQAEALGLLLTEIARPDSVFCLPSIEAKLRKANAALTKRVRELYAARHDRKWPEYELQRRRREQAESCSQRQSRTIAKLQAELERHSSTILTLERALRRTKKVVGHPPTKTRRA